MAKYLVDPENDPLGFGIEANESESASPPKDLPRYGVSPEEDPLGFGLPPEVVSPEKPGLLDKLTQRAKNIGGYYKDVGTMITKGAKSPLDMVRPTLYTMGELGGAWGDIVGEALKKGWDYLASDNAKYLAGKGKELLMKHTTLPDVINKASTFIEGAKTANPQAAKDLEAYWAAFGGIPGMAMTKKSVGAVASEARKVASDIGTYAGKRFNLGTAIEPELEAVVKEGMSKGVSRSAYGIGNVEALREQTRKAGSAIKDIVAAKPYLEFVDETGKTVTGRLPRSAYEFGEALSQAKTRLWGEIDRRLAQAGRGGVTIDLMPIAEELRKVGEKLAANAETSRLSPYAFEWAKEYAGKRYMTPAQAEEALKKLNHDLASYYFDKSKGASIYQDIDLARSRFLRDALDKAMDKYGGVAEIKERWGALKSLEKDVAHRAQIVGRQKKKGFFDLGDAWNIPEIAYGIFTMKPSIIGRGLTGIGVKEYMKWVDRNDRIIKNMFEKAEKLIDRQKAYEGHFIPQSRIGQVITGMHGGPVSPRQSLVPTGIKRDIFPTGSAIPMRDVYPPTFTPSLPPARPGAMAQPQISLADVLGVPTRKVEAEAMRQARPTVRGQMPTEFAGVPRPSVVSYGPWGPKEDFIFRPVSPPSPYTIPAPLDPDVIRRLVNEYTASVYGMFNQPKWLRLIDEAARKKLFPEE